MYTARINKHAKAECSHYWSYERGDYSRLMNQCNKPAHALAFASAVNFACLTRPSGASPRGR